MNAVIWLLFVIEFGWEYFSFKMSGNSSSDDSEDENAALLREAVDTELISDAMFNKGKKSWYQLRVYLMFVHNALLIVWISRTHF